MTTFPLTQFNFRILGVWNPISELGLLPKSPKEWILAKQRFPPLARPLAAWRRPRAAVRRPGAAARGLPRAVARPSWRRAAVPPPGFGWGVKERGIECEWVERLRERERDWI